MSDDADYWPDEDLFVDDKPLPKRKPGPAAVVHDPVAANAAKVARETALAKREQARMRERSDKAAQNLADRPVDAQLAQIANLHIAGYSLEQIAAGLGMTTAEVDHLLTSQMSRYVRSQPALRTWTRHWISNRYALLLDAVWDEAVGDKAAGVPANLDNVVVAERLLNRMGKLHGAEAPVQSEVKVEAAPEMVEQMVAALSSQTGVGYDDEIFDAEIIEDAPDTADMPRQLLAAVDHDLTEADEIVSGNTEQSEEADSDE